MNNDILKHIEETAGDWESTRLGQDVAYAAVSDLDGKDLDAALGLKAISIRLPVTLIDDLKALSTFHHIGYQPLIRDLLLRFVKAEKKRFMANAVEKVVEPMQDTVAEGFPQDKAA